ncbi:hypothetical protein JTE90_016349 [Oedothorax gibbosus]|uniref:MATH domain-containing protein n=1 Tax=Oedothorax gibbosus TaxID=931172 RepID=A0AAV6TLA5_9ARAC|nr:hypothetical protein JTE90_016349 [Oedothorax gibbosus]
MLKRVVLTEQLYNRKFIRYGAILLKVVLFREEIRPPRFATLTLSQRHLAAKFDWSVPDLPDRTRSPDPGSFLDSDMFYLSNSGYRMMLRLYPARTDRHVGMYAVLAKGAYDDDLDWPFRLSFKLEVTTGDRTFTR